MFKTNLKERYSNKVEVQGAPETAVKSIIDYFYLESIEIKGETVMDLLAASDYLQVDDVKQFCFDFLQSNISQQNCFSLLNAANLSRHSRLVKQLHKYISTNFDLVTQTKTFLLLCIQDFTGHLLKLDKTQIKQMSLYQALIAWTKFDKTTREKEFAKFFPQLLDVNKLSITDVENVLLKERLITGNDNCYKLVQNAFSKLLEEKRRASFHQQKLSKVISLAGWNTGQKVCDVYNSQDNALQSYPDLPERIIFDCS